MDKIKIRIDGLEIEAKLHKTDLARKIWDIMPIEQSITRWGDEIYFQIPLEYDIKKQTIDVEIGDLCYWPHGQCFCIFYGPTPLSNSEKPVPADSVEVFGRITQDVTVLKDSNGETVIVSHS